MRVKFISWNEFERSLMAQGWDLQSRFLDLVEPHLETTLLDWKRAIEQQAQQIDDEDQRDMFREFHSEEYQQRLEFRIILMNWFFAASFALFENQLMEICESAQQECGNPFSVEDLGSHSPIDRAKVYLTKLGIQFPANTPEWQEITKYRQIRNRIAHQGGDLPTEGDVTDFAKANKIVSRWGGGPRLALTRPFCDDAVSNLKQFVLGVHKAYERWLKTSE